MPENQFFQFQNQKSTKFAEYSQRTYHEVTYLLALGIFVVVGSFGIYKLLGPIKISEENKRIIIYLIISGVPYMLLSWFGAFLFIFWDFHMSRLYIDYWDKIMATKIYGNPAKYKLLFHDFLGVRNDAKIWKIRAVYILYAAIAIPGVLILLTTFGISITYVCTHTEVLKKFIADYILSKPKMVIGDWIIYVPLSFYILGIVAVGILMGCSHIKCIARKKKLMSEIAKELNGEVILDYLSKIPNAGDTLEGIFKWLLNIENIKNIKYSVEDVSMVLEGLVKRRLIKGGNPIYRICKKD